MKNAQWRIGSRRAAWLAAAGMLAAPAFVQAESTFTSSDTSASISTDARLDFRIVIPRILFLQVGTGGAFPAGNSTINEIRFDVAAPRVGFGDGVTVSGGDAGTGSVQARVIGNTGKIILSSSTTGPLRNATDDTISFSQITTTSTALNSATKLDAPALADGAITSVDLLPSGSQLVNRDATWTFAFANSALVSAGTYGANGNSGRVTYTATAP